jgi:hypothetical protein
MPSYNRKSRNWRRTRLVGLALGPSFGSRFGFALKLAFVAGNLSHTLLALPPVDFLAVCAVRGIVRMTGDQSERRGGWDDEIEEKRSLIKRQGRVRMDTEGIPMGRSGPSYINKYLFIELSKIKPGGGTGTEGIQMGRCRTGYINKYLII